MTALTQAPIQCQSYPSLAQLFESLATSAAALIICAIENSEVGSFRSVYERVVSHKAFIVGEFALKSTCPEDGDGTETAQTIWTRYVFVSLREYPTIQFAPRIALKASLVLGLSHEAGSIFRILSCFAMRNVNVLKFEMRSAKPFTNGQSASPFSGNASQADLEAAASPFISSRSAQWSYLFYVDYALSPSDQVNSALLASLKEFSITLVQLGVYQQNLTSDDAEAQPVSAATLSHA